MLTILGARPQFIKAAIVSDAIAKTPALTEIIVHSGQHYDDSMSKVFFAQLHIPTPRYFLDCGMGTHAEQVGRMLPSLERIVRSESPDWVLVYGDTNTTLAAALASSKVPAPVAHVEAGLRCFNRNVPEEINRIVTDHISALLFCPTEQAVRNLLMEGKAKKAVYQVGDVMYDCAERFAPIANGQSRILADYELMEKPFVVATVHRQENTDDATKLLAIFSALEEVSRKVTVVMPLHPRTRDALARIGFMPSGAELRIIPPVSYFDMLVLLGRARLVVTDSGGLQKEAFFFEVPCITLRNETEWIELLECGWNRLVTPQSSQQIVSEIYAALYNDRGGRPRPKIYGDGDASVRIAGLLAELSAELVN